MFSCANAMPAQDAAQALVSSMTAEEKTRVLHGIMALPGIPGTAIPPEALLGAGYVPGVPRVGFPALRESDASLGVAYILGLRHDGATALPSSLSTAASFDPTLAYDGGAVAGREAWLKGFNILLGGGVNLARDPRGGRNFEYLGEDPLLAGVMAGAAVRGTQDQHVISTVKHFAVNDQETLRQSLSAVVSEQAVRESDLLAFEIAIQQGHPGAVMCAYNRVNDPYACENGALLNGVLKGDWAYPGWVMSDWGATHGLHAALDGLDQQSGEQLDPAVVFGKPLLDAAARDPAYAARLTDAATRIARSLYRVGVMDHPPRRGPIDIKADGAIALRASREGVTLLRNEGGVLPLSPTIGRIAVIGGHADLGVLSGGGSSQVAPPGGPAVDDKLGGEGPLAMLRHAFYLPGAPMAAIKAAAPRAEVHFDDGRYPSAAAELARRADVAIVFATQWQMEGYDVPDLSLPDGQDAMIAAVAAANPNTIVVLQTGGPVLMPWLGQVRGVIEAWYPGAQGGQAIADVLFGRVSPSGRLPITFPASVEQLPRRALPGWGLPEGTRIDVAYVEGSDVGYRGFAATGQRPLFPFGFGLSYTHFSYDGLQVEAGDPPRVSAQVSNAGGRAGADVVQLYLIAAPHRRQQRLIGWARVMLEPGQSRRVDLAINPLLLCDWDEGAHGWRRDAGAYHLAVGASASDMKLTTIVQLAAQRRKP